MGDTYLRVLTYNTHLFGYDFKSEFGNAWTHVTKDWTPTILDDDPRKFQLKWYLGQNTDPNGPQQPILDLVVFQEVWSGSYANNFKKDLAASFSAFFAKDDKHKEFNGSGLILHGIQGIDFPTTDHFDFISHCKGDGYDTQDEYSQKGYLSATATLSKVFDSGIRADAAIPFGLIGCHMITSQGSYPSSATLCYQVLHQLFVSYASGSPAMPSLLFCDLNCDEDKGLTFRGEFDPNASYAIDDVVSHTTETVILGVTKTTIVCHAAIAASAGPGNALPEQNPTAWVQTSSKFAENILNVLCTFSGSEVQATINEAYRDSRAAGGATLESDPAYSVDSVQNTFWPLVNEKDAELTQERIDYIFRAAPPAANNASTTMEFVYAALLKQPGLRINGKVDNEDCSDHFPLFAIVKVSDPRIAEEGGVVPVLCYSANYQRFQFTLAILPKSGGWSLECAPFFAYQNGTRHVPVYAFQTSSPAGLDYRYSTSDTPPGSEWSRAGISFYATTPDDPRGVLPIYEFSDGTHFAYFPSPTVMPPAGWSPTSSSPAFYSPKRGTLS